MELVAIPNVRSDLPNITRNAELLRRMLDRRSMKPEVWETPSTPLVYGDRLMPSATRTILFYIHFDGQWTGRRKEVIAAVHCAAASAMVSIRTGVLSGSRTVVA